MKKSFFIEDLLSPGKSDKKDRIKEAIPDKVDCDSVDEKRYNLPLLPLLCPPRISGTDGGSGPLSAADAAGLSLRSTGLVNNLARPMIPPAFRHLLSPLSVGLHPLHAQRLWPGPLRASPTELPQGNLLINYIQYYEMLL